MRRQAYRTRNDCGVWPAYAVHVQPESGGVIQMKQVYRITAIALCAILLCCGTQRRDTRTGALLDATCVPESLRDLVPLAARWGIADPVAREEMEKEMTGAQACEVRDALHARASGIRSWLGTEPARGECADEAAAFGGLLDLYEDFSDMQLMRGLK